MDRPGDGLAGQKRDWEALAEIDPLWAILGDPSRRGRRWDTEDFFATAEATLEPIFATAHELERPRGWNRALDFGCGVGRITRALANRFDASVGVDIAERMVTLARELNADYPSCTFLLNEVPDLRQFETDSFDLVFENLVLQHLPEKAQVWNYVAEFLRVVRPDGLVVLQLPCWVRWPYRFELQRRIYAVLRRLGAGDRLLQDSLRLTPIRMLTIPQDEAELAIVNAGGRLLRAELRGSKGDALRYLRYYVVAGASRAAS